MLPEIPFFESFWYFVAALLAMIAWRIWGDRVMRAVRRFDQRRRDADLQAYFDRMNPNAHFRQSVDQIGEATPAVRPVAANDPRAAWNGVTYATREEAEAARWRHIIMQARAFYIDLDRSYGNRIRAKPSSSTLGDGGSGGGETRH
jgi:hypothetical protein